MNSLGDYPPSEYESLRVTRHAALRAPPNDQRARTNPGLRQPSPPHLGAAAQSLLGYQSQLLDPTTGLVDMGARQYDPSQGRFTTQDTVYGSPTPLTLNQYIYADDSPLDNADPTRCRRRRLMTQLVSRSHRWAKGGAVGGALGSAAIVGYALLRTSSPPPAWPLDALLVLLIPIGVRSVFVLAALRRGGPWTIISAAGSLAPRSVLTVSVLWLIGAAGYLGTHSLPTGQPVKRSGAWYIEGSGVPGGIRRVSESTAEANERDFILYSGFVLSILYTAALTVSWRDHEASGYSLE